MALSEQEIAGKQQALCNRLGALTAQYEYQKASIVAEFKQLDEQLADARIAEGKKTPETLRADLDALTAKIAAMTAANNQENK